MNRITISIIIALFCLSILITNHFSKKHSNYTTEQENGVSAEEETAKVDLSPIKHISTDAHYFQDSIVDKRGQDILYTDNTYLFKFTLANNTNQQITRFRLVGCLHLEFQGNNNRVYFPDNSLNNNNNFDDYNDFECAISSSEINLEHKWKPNENRQFKFILYALYNSFVQSNFGFKNVHFERTPITAELIYKYKAIGIDGEYEDIVRIDILDDWKAYQTKLGLR